jgi:hypothetical protein
MFVRHGWLLDGADDRVVAQVIREGDSEITARRAAAPAHAVPIWTREAAPQVTITFRRTGASFGSSGRPGLVTKLRPP